jgi:hypothetical protein
VEVSRQHERKPPPPPKITKPPSIQWQQRGLSFIKYAEDLMWQQDNNPAMAYFMAGGLTTETILRARLGWNKGNWMDRPERWGFEPESSGSPRIFLGQGAVIPLFAYGVLWGIKIRYIPRNEYPKGKFQKYGGPRGSVSCLYGLDDMRPGFPALYVEGERDRLLAWQELGAVIDPVTTGGAAKRIPQEAIAPLLHCPALLVAHDGDSAGLLGRKRILEQVAYRAVPIPVPNGHDLTSMHTEIVSLKTWFVNSIGNLLGAAQGDSPASAIELLTERLALLREEKKCT